MRGRIILDAGNIGAICRENALANGTRRQRRAAGTGEMTVFVDGTQTGMGIELFARDIRIVDLTLKLDLLITTSTATLADILS